jgi:hypothetical protein
MKIVKLFRGTKVVDIPVEQPTQVRASDQPKDR